MYNCLISSQVRGGQDDCSNDLLALLIHSVHDYNSFSLRHDQTRFPASTSYPGGFSPSSPSPPNTVPATSGLSPSTPRAPNGFSPLLVLYGVTCCMTSAPSSGPSAEVDVGWGGLGERSSAVCKVGTGRRNMLLRRSELGLRVD